MKPILPSAHDREPRGLFNANRTELTSMPEPQPLGIYYGNMSWFLSNDFSWFPDNVFKNKPWAFGKPEDHQSVKLMAKINEKVSMKPDRPGHVGQAMAVYDAQILKNNQTALNHIIVKIVLR